MHKFGGTTRIVPSERRMYRDTLYTGMWHEEAYGWHLTGLFPIIRRDCDTCPQVRGVEFFKGSATQFFLRWQRGANHHDWQVSVCPSGTAPEDGTMYTSADPISQLITVDPDSHYVAYVRARCRFALDEWGPWSDPVGVWLNEPSEGVEAAEGGVPVAVAPNPAADRVVVSAEGGIDRVEVYAEGGTLTATLAGGGSRTLAIDTGRWPKGAYLLRIHTPQGTATRKLVVE